MGSAKLFSVLHDLSGGVATVNETRMITFSIQHSTFNIQHSGPCGRGSKLEN
jgi:hypothetical protein